MQCYEFISRAIPAAAIIGFGIYGSIVFTQSIGIIIGWATGG